MGYYGFSSTEVNFFNKIKSEIDVMFDIGSRDDTDYLENSLDKSRSFHVFEPDPNFLISCQKQIEKLDAPEGIENEVYLNNFGLGSQEGELEYYPCKKNKIKHIDFMKIDIEGMEIDVFNGGKEIINNGTDIIQFEFASTMLDRDLNPDDLVGWFDRKMWSLFLLRVEHNHPFYSQNNQLLTKLDDSTYQRVRQDMIERSGCNLVAIKKELSDKIYKLANHD
jgi:hypothetical protein